jgi:hypothetical protein
MKNFYFILNPKEYILIIAESESLAIEVFNRFSLSNTKRYAYICNSITKGSGHMLEVIKQRATQ